MPELEGARALDDIMEGHRAAGRFNAERWRLGYIPGRPEAASVLLLAEVPGRDVWEVVYLGLTPAARGQGLGRVVLQHALELARATCSRLELAVDCRNTPATRLYHAAGFMIRDRRAVHLAILDQRRVVAILAIGAATHFRRPSGRHSSPDSSGAGAHPEPVCFTRAGGGANESKAVSPAEPAGRCRRISPCLR